MLTFFTKVVTQAQTPVLDSLKLALKKCKHDTSRCDILGRIIDSEVNDFAWAKYNDEKMALCLANLKKNLSAREIMLFKGHYAASLINYSYFANKRGDIKKSLDYLHKALKLLEEMNEPRGISNCINNIGVTYIEIGEIDKGIEYLNRSLKINEKLDDKIGMGNILGNIGLCYRNKSDFKNALIYLNKSLELFNEIRDSSDIAYTLNSIAGTYLFMKDKENALAFFDRSLKMQRAIGDVEGEAGTLISVAMAYFRFKDYNKAIEFLSRSKKMNQEQGNAKRLSNAARHLYKVYKETGNYKAALENYELYIQMRDSISNESNRKAAIKSQLKYEYEKQAAADSVAHVKESEIKNAEIAKQTAEIKAKKNQQYALFSGLGLVMIFAGFMYNRFKVTQKQKEIIDRQKSVVEEQKHIVEEKQKEILDSIRYAQRIQKAHLPNEKFIAKNLERLKKS